MGTKLPEAHGFVLILIACMHACLQEEDIELRNTPIEWDVARYVVVPLHQHVICKICLGYQMTQD